jgi:hypothetical protein
MFRVAIIATCRIRERVLKKEWFYVYIIEVWLLFWYYFSI